VTERTLSMREILRLKQTTKHGGAGLDNCTEARRYQCYQRGTLPKQRATYKDVLRARWDNGEKNL
jgi:hypothetical protein